MEFEFEQCHLFEDRPLPNWLPDETLFSLLSRHHVVSGNLRDETTCQQLFGPRRKRCLPDFPNWIDSLVERTRGLLGSAEDIICQHTLLPVYLPFQTMDEALQCMNAMRGSGLGRLRPRLCRQTPNEQTVRPLRACAHCMQDDLKDHQVAYWHVEHQLPGMLICLKHGAVLLQSASLVTQHASFRWYLPRDTELVEPAWTLADIGLNGGHLLQRVGQMALAHYLLPSNFHFDGAELERTYLQALRELSGGLNPWEFTTMMSCAKRFHKHFACLTPVDEFKAIHESINSAAKVLAMSLSPETCGRFAWNDLCVRVWLCEVSDQGSSAKLSLALRP